ncbi:RHS repeat-associated protein [Chitinophaga polysaccharea]|uniref:RHS repeat-associated protein n=1 Tax=Chitinophaga polysaccharea TaxID=1293035 RepID=A0A561PQF3_9BACT|nr:RHS repeat-associated protein [Chitinophaga polysaccharea]
MRGCKGRWALAGGYRYGFNGKENDNEVKGEGNQQDYGMRIYDPRIGKFLSVDPLTKKYPELTPYQFSSNSPILNVDLDGEESIPHYIAKGIRGTFTISTFASVSFGSVQSMAKGMGYDKNGNVALFYSRTAGPSVATNLGYDVGIKASFLPGIKDVSGITGMGTSFGISGGIPQTHLSVGGSLEYNSDEKLVGWGLQISGGHGIAPASWSMESTNTTAVLFSEGEYKRFSSFADGSDKRNMSRMMEWNDNEANRDANNTPYGIWTLGSSMMSLQPVKDQNGIFEAVITTQFNYMVTGGHRDGIQQKDQVVKVEDRSGVFFTKPDDENYKSVNYKQSEN